jgi:multiple sugar transport system permease protein
MAATARTDTDFTTNLYRTIGKPFGRTASNVREAMWGTLFVSPWILGLLIFTIGPILVSLYWGFTEFDILGTPQWIGIDNYVSAFNLQNWLPFWSHVRGDRLFSRAVINTVIFSGVTVPVGTAGSLLLAILLNQKLRGTYFYRTLFFMPQLVPSVASVILWKALLHPRTGIVNAVIKMVTGLEGPGWLNDPNSAMLSVVMIGLWGSIGGSRMLIFLAGLQGVPQELYEAADLDGAGAWNRFWNVTLPMISPTLLFNIILGVIGALQVFNIAFIGTQGGPQYATWFYALHIYRQAFEYFRMGYGSALAWIFALALIIFTWIQMRFSERWVYYAGGS